MKKILALVIVAILVFATMIPAALAADDATVYVSVSVDGDLKIAAQPVTVSTLTVEAALKEAHAQYYSGGESGFNAGIDPTYNMYMINSFWGVATTPYVILNSAPLGSGANAMYASADTAPVADGDNLIVSISTDFMNPSPAVALTADVADGNATITASSWTLDFTTFQYTSSPLAGRKVFDADGAELGTTGSDGKITVPASGVAVVDGLAAIPADGTSKSTGDTVVAVAPPPAGGFGTGTGFGDFGGGFGDFGGGFGDFGSSGALPPYEAPAPGEGITVYVTISAEGVVVLASQPVEIKAEGASVAAAIQAANAIYGPEGEAGFEGSASAATYNMYRVNKCWGATGTANIVKNDAVLGAGSNAEYYTADTCPVEEGDCVTIAISSDGRVPAVSLTYNDHNGMASVSSWAMDMSTFTYGDTALEGAEIIDAETGEVLGKTNQLGAAKLSKIPDCGVIAYQGAAACAIDKTKIKSFTPYDGEYVAPAHDYSVFGGPDGRSLKKIVIIGLSLSIPLAIIVIYAFKKEIKYGGLKYGDASSANTRIKFIMK